jgi:hypothetical protein
MAQPHNRILLAVPAGCPNGLVRISAGMLSNWHPYRDPGPLTEVTTLIRSSRRRVIAASAGARDRELLPSSG